VYATPLKVKDGIVIAAEVQLSMVAVPSLTTVPPVIGVYVPAELLKV
jgi:hypothetical protein